MDPIEVYLLSIQVAPPTVVLNLRDSQGRNRTKTYPIGAFMRMARIIGSGKPDGLLGLDICSDGVGRRMVTRLDDGTKANMGAYLSHGPAHHLMRILSHDRTPGQQIQWALTQQRPLTMSNRLLDT